MTREELKGEQTPGTAMMDDGPFVYLLNDINSNRTYAQVQPGWECVGFRTSKKECLANAALYAEAHNVANETGMWPMDMVERIRELEAVVAHAHRVMLYRGWNTLARPSLEADAWDAVDAAHLTILNKKS